MKLMKNNALSTPFGQARRTLIAGAVAALTVLPFGTVMASDTIATPTGDVLLTVKGAISTTSDGAMAYFDRDMLDALPQTSFETSTQWTEGVSRFSGPTLAAILAHVGADGATVKAKAINDYVVEIGLDTVSDEAPIIATQMDGENMSVRTKGPLWIVFPYDRDEKYRTGEVFSNSIWQLVELEVTPR